MNNSFARPPLSRKAFSDFDDARLKLLLQDAVLFDQVGDHGRLLAADPASEGSQEELQIDGFDHAASVSEVRQGVTPQRVSVFGHHALILCGESVRRKLYRHNACNDFCKELP